MFNTSRIISGNILVECLILPVSSACCKWHIMICLSVNNRQTNWSTAAWAKLRLSSWICLNTSLRHKPGVSTFFWLFYHFISALCTKKAEPLCIFIHKYIQIVQREHFLLLSWLLSPWWCYYYYHYLYYYYPFWQCSSEIMINSFVLFWVAVEITEVLPFPSLHVMGHYYKLQCFQRTLLL